MSLNETRKKVFTQFKITSDFPDFDRSVVATGHLKHFDASSEVTKG